MNRFFIGSDFQKGYGLGMRIGNQTGYGIGGLFTKFFNYVKPYLLKAKEHALPILKSGAETVGKEVVKSVADIAKDVIEGRNFQDSAKQHLNRTVDSLATKAEQKMTGHGYKRGLHFKKLDVKKKKRILDIFD